MGQSVKLSDELVDDAWSVVPFTQRSIAGQIEFWAGLDKPDLVRRIDADGSEKVGRFVGREIVPVEGENLADCFAFSISVRS